MFTTFAKNTRGNTALFVALTLFPIILLLGGAVDLTRASHAKTQLQAASDAAALAAANFTQEGDAETVVREYLAANLTGTTAKYTSFDVTASRNDATSSRSVNIRVNAKLPTHFLRLMNKPELDIVVETQAQQAVSNIELAMVLDISSSMRGSKVANLRDAAEDFVEDMLEGERRRSTSINLVPFGGTVNVGTEIFNKYAADASTGEFDPSERDYDEGGLVPTRRFRFTNGDTCLEVPNANFNDARLNARGHGQVPNFWRWWNSHPWCPGQASKAVFNSGDRDDLVDRIRNMTLSDGTGMNYGALWGLKSLSPNWRGELGGDFSGRPAAYDDADTLKAMVIMTDGEITDQNRPEDFTVGNVHTNRAQNRAPNVNAFSNQGNRRNMQTVLNRGNASSDASSNTAVGQFRRVCEQAKQNGIVVYTIGFQINRNGLSNTLLGECATDPTKYILVEDLNIQAAFDEIAASLSRLRIVG